MTINGMGFFSFGCVVFMAAIFVWVMAHLRHHRIRQDLQRSEQHMIDAQTHYEKTSRMLQEWALRAEEKLSEDE